MLPTQKITEKQIILMPLIQKIIKHHKTNSLHALSLKKYQISLF